MNSNKCRQVRREIDELDISRQPGEGLTAHLASCSACAQFRLERANLRGLIGGLEPVAAPADFDMRLRARIARERTGGERQPFLTRLIGMPAIAAMAMVVLTVGAVVWIGQRDSKQSNQVASENSPAPLAGQGGGAGTAEQDQPAVATAPKSDEHKDLVADNKKGFASRRPKSSPRSVRSADYGLASMQESVKASDSFVNAPSKPVVVSLEDDRGTKRNIKLPPVSFGAQSLVDNRVPASYMGNSRVW